MSYKIKPSFYIIGAGRVGSALAFHLENQKFSIKSIVENKASRLQYLKNHFTWNFLKSKLNSRELQKATIILISVGDQQILNIVMLLSQLQIDWSNKIVSHFSGALPAEVLQPLQQQGASIASLHPVYSFSNDPRDNKNLDEIWFDIEGDHLAQKTLKKIFKTDKNRIICVEKNQKLAIHIACVFFANFNVALAQICSEITINLNLSPTDQFIMFRPLLHSTMSQIFADGPRKALTGPLKRADKTTIIAHLNFLKIHYPDLLNIYIEMSQKLISISGLPKKEIEKLEKILRHFD
jgi:predicted short-subunit dehydrogenase-like oxidoreductase (DUF2520 family)